VKIIDYSYRQLDSRPRRPPPPCVAPRPPPAAPRAAAHMMRAMAAALAGAALQLLTLLDSLPGGQAHGHMTLPPSRNGGTLAKAADCLHGECMWFSQPNSNFTKNPATGGRPDDPIARIPGEPTLDAQPLRTYNVDVSDGVLDYTRTSPWRHPGSAPVLGSGCGVGAGGPEREMDGGTAREFGLVQNKDGASLPRLNLTTATTWKRGSTQEVAWANNANHVRDGSVCCADGQTSQADCVWVAGCVGGLYSGWRLRLPALQSRRHYIRGVFSGWPPRV
jgi:hypothetical protein